MSAAPQRRLLVDVTQYACWPALSGVQRVLLHLAEGWQATTVDARFGFVDDGGYAIGPMQALGTVIRAAFSAQTFRPATDAAGIRAALRDAANEVVATRDVADVYDAYLLPEPTLQDESLAVAKSVAASGRSTPFFVYYDALPLTHPQFYPRGADRDGRVTRYHREVAKADNVAFISKSTRDVFERRLARRSLHRAIVARPGADGLPSVRAVPPEPATFAILGTIEPRKRHRVVLEAFEHLWAAGWGHRLLILGGEGWENPEFLEALRSHSSRIDWIERPSDDDVADSFARATAVIFTPHAEGFGLPPLEALAAGCPVIVDASLPALNGLDGGGQIRLPVVTPHTVAAAVETLAEPSTNAEYRRAIGEVCLPTWNRFTRDVEGWIESVLSDNDLSQGSR